MQVPSNGTLVVPSKAEITKMGNVELARLYSTLIKELPRDERPPAVKRFENRQVARKRVLAVLRKLPGVCASDEPSVKTPDEPSVETPDEAAAPAASVGTEATPAAETEAKAPTPAKPPRRFRGTSLDPLPSGLTPCLEGSKQARLLDQVARPEGATMDDLCKALDWTESSVRSGLGWGLRRMHGYGVRSQLVDGVERFFVVLPASAPRVLPHRPRKQAVHAA